MGACPGLIPVELPPVTELPDPKRQRWPEARALFEAALALPRAEREAYVRARAMLDTGFYARDYPFERRPPLIRALTLLGTTPEALRSRK